MFLLRAIFSWFDTILDRIFTIAGALLFSQVPRFIEIYVDMLRGALHEARRQVELIEAQARANGKTIDQFIAKHLDSNDPDFAGSGRVMQSSVDAFEKYRDAYDAIGGAGIFQKPFVFISHVDLTLLGSMDFTPGIPFTTEALVYGFAGILFGLLVYHILKSPITLINMKRAERARKRHASEGAR